MQEASDGAARPAIKVIKDHPRRARGRRNEPEKGARWWTPNLSRLLHTHAHSAVPCNYKQTLHGIGGDTHLGACFDAATDCDHPGSARPMEVLPRRPVPALPSSFSCTLTVGSETKSSPVREREGEKKGERDDTLVRCDTLVLDVCY